MRPGRKPAPQKNTDQVTIAPLLNVNGLLRFTIQRKGCRMTEINTEEK